MVRIDVVVTRGGDSGETSLGDGARLRKDAARFAVIGGVDEANAAIGVLRLATRDVPEADAMLARIQNDLFDVGADLSVPGEAGERLRMTDVSVARLAGWQHRRRACARGTHGRPAGGARSGAVGGRGNGDAGADALPQPPIGPPVRIGACVERQRCG
jgi:cob(I)alamin adenosyltransferase